MIATTVPILSSLMKHLFHCLLLFVSGSLALHASPDLTHGRRGPTPYDPYMQPVHAVLNQLNGTAPSFERVSTLLKEGWKFEYSFDTPYIASTPEVTAARHAGDCKAKSLWLASQMNDASVRYIIGKARSTSKISHAWLMWKNKGQWWILDPTNASRPIAANSVAPNEYLVLFSYDQTGSYAYNFKPSRGRRTVAAGHN